MTDTGDETAPQAIMRGKGLPRSERLLADLGEHAFLNLWSYPNVFYDKKQHGNERGFQSKRAMKDSKPPRSDALRRAGLMVENCTYGQPYDQYAEST